MPLTRYNTAIANKFYDDHLFDSAGRTAAELIRAAINICRRRAIARNTVLYVTQTLHDNFITSAFIRVFGNTYRSNIKVPIAVTLSSTGVATLTTNAQFRYSLAVQGAHNVVYHFFGLDGGVNTDLRLRPYRLVSNTRLYAEAKFGATRGWRAQSELVRDTGVTNGAHTLVELFDSTRPTLEGRKFYILTQELRMSPMRMWFTYGGFHHEL